MSEPDDDELEPKRHTFLQEEARMLSPLFKAHEATGNEWRNQALCHQLACDGSASLNAWFAPDGTDVQSDAVAACFDCPVRKECLEWACTAKIQHGVWGGQPRTVRLQKNLRPDKFRPHMYLKLVDLPNPYDTTDARSAFHRDKIEVWDGTEDE
jgi:hypothetical protein